MGEKKKKQQNLPAEAGGGRKHLPENFIPLSELNLSDGFLFGEVMRDEETCRTVLEIILKRPISRIVYVDKEYPVEAATNYHKYKGIRLDIYFRDEENTRYSVEMQTQNRYHLPKRSRHYQGMLDVQMLPAGETDYHKLCDSILIFICTFDLFGRGRCCYTFENTCLEEPELRLEDGATRIFLNTEGTVGAEDNRLLVEFLRYVVDRTAPVESPQVQKIKERVETVKRNQETETRYMTSLTYVREIYEDGKEDGIAEGKTIGIAEGKADSILELLSDKGEIPEEIRETISGEKDLERLKNWLKLAVKVESVEEFWGEMGKGQIK